MPDVPVVTLRSRTDDDLDVLYRLAADLDSWEERTESAPTPLTRATFDAHLPTPPTATIRNRRWAFVVDVNGAAVGSASLSGFDSLARHAEASISLLSEARGRGVGTAAMGQLVEFGFVRLNLRPDSTSRRSRRTSARSGTTGRRGLCSRGGYVSTPGSGEPTRTSC